MTGRVLKTDRAERDIDQIADWIARGSESAAHKWLGELDEKFSVIARTPGIGTDRNSLRRGVRSYAFGNYLIFFKATKSGVSILRVIHGARDYRRFFK
ncbi:MAG TPA: type II toxin-antitoxin system RelE/ParE family toxin [Tepidisphaeraceae bacterium]|jgi:toxin ParE1/3/4|nr:type II toxin-antitoxin system RelE/ParE family toxin [Tepidisphaeraceae bacterium]HEV8606170.1 type II toxin-antitoxin system RelE/ParE family toxin [Tepidisphaeraceae bacterium]